MNTSEDRDYAEWRTAKVMREYVPKMDYRDWDVLQGAIRLAIVEAVEAQREACVQAVKNEPPVPLCEPTPYAMVIHQNVIELVAAATVTVKGEGE